MVVEFVLLIAHAFMVSGLAGLVWPTEGQYRIATPSCSELLTLLKIVAGRVQDSVVAISIAIAFPMLLFATIWIVLLAVLSLANLTKGKARHHFSYEYHGIPYRSAAPSKSSHDFTVQPPITDRGWQGSVLRFIFGPVRPFGEKMELRSRVAEFFWSHTCFRKYR
jgi:hypothetical protein